MNSNINAQTNVGSTASLRNLASLFKLQLASIGGYAENLGPVKRGLVALVILLALAIVTISVLLPRKVTPASASLAVFSGERAMIHLPVIASEPHPQGSPALARVRDYLVQELTAAGLEVEVQRVAGLENVVARLRGTNPTGAIIILTHYDTVAYSAGAGDNSSAVATQLEIMRALAAGSPPHNDVIALFHDGEEYPGMFDGTKMFIQKHPWMKDVRVAISIDSAVAGFVSAVEVGPKNNGWLVHALAQAYDGGGWMSFSGGGVYNSTPFREAGIPVLALEDGYPFRQKHTEEDLPEIIQPGSVQQLGEQTLAITRVLGEFDLADPWGEQETFFSVPMIGFFHYPEAWSIPLAIVTGLILILALGLSLWRKLVSWRGLAIAFGAILVTVVLCVIGIDKLRAAVVDLMGWNRAGWQEWPEVIPPYGWIVVSIFDLLVLGLVTGIYMLVRRWSRRVDFSLIGLLPFTVAGVVLAFAEPRTAYAFTWPVLVSSLGWIAAITAGKNHMSLSIDLAAMLAAVTFTLMLIMFPPGLVMADGMKSLEIIAGIEVVLLMTILPAIDSLLVRQGDRRTSV